MPTANEFMNDSYKLQAHYKAKSFMIPQTKNNSKRVTNFTKSKRNFFVLIELQFRNRTTKI